jgi:hypothetical protein
MALGRAKLPFHNALGASGLEIQVRDVWNVGGVVRRGIACVKRDRMLAWSSWTLCTGKFEMKRASAIALVLVLYVFAPGIARANTITLPVGQISFDNFLPANPPAPGTNAFNVINFTGGFPVASALTFNTASFSLVSASGIPINVPVGNLGPGPLLDPSGNPLFSLQFADTTTFSSATFTATLSQTTFLLSNGVVATLVGTPMISATILPSSGTTLNAGVDFAVLTVTASVPNTAIPEPGTLVLLGTGLAAGCRLKRRRA